MVNIETGNVRTVDVEALLEAGSRRARIILRKMVERECGRFATVIA